MSLERENAAFHNPEPEVEYFPALENCFADLDSERKRKRVPSESRSAKHFLVLENFLRSVRGL